MRKFHSSGFRPDLLAVFVDPARRPHADVACGAAGHSIVTLDGPSGVAAQVPGATSKSPQRHPILVSEILTPLDHVAVHVVKAKLVWMQAMKCRCHSYEAIGEGS